MLEGFGAQPARQAQKPAPFILVNPVPSTPCAAGPAPGCLGRLFWGSCCFPVPQRSPVSLFPAACRYVARKMRTLWSREPREPPPCPAQAAPQSHHRSKCGLVGTGTSTPLIPNLLGSPGLSSTFPSGHPGPGRSCRSFLLSPIYLSSRFVDKYHCNPWQRGGAKSSLWEGGQACFGVGLEGPEDVICSHRALCPWDTLCRSGPC